MKMAMSKKEGVMALVSMVVLIVVLNQAHLTESYLGRIVLLSCIVIIAAVNKIAGLIAVLVVMVAIQRQTYTVHSYNFYEGFTSTANANTNANATADKDKKNSTPEVAKEGFCLSDKEATMLRGKQSNTIPVSNASREQVEDVSPSSKSIFSGDYGSV
jgi:hypothetical protein